MPSKKEVAKKEVAKKEVKKPGIPGDAVVRRLTKISSPEGKSVLTETFPAIKALLAENYNKFAALAIDALLKANEKLASKGSKKAPSKNAGFDLLKPIFKELGEDVSKEDALNMMYCNSPKKIEEADDADVMCLYMSRGAFKKYLIMGSDDGEMTAHFAPKLAPKVPAKKAPAKKAAVPRGVGFTFRKEFLNGLQWAIERATAQQIEEAWHQMNPKQKRLTFAAFESAGLARVSRPEPKARKAPAKKASVKAPPKKTAGRKKKDASEEEKPKKASGKKAPPKKTTGRKKKDASEEEKPKKASGKKARKETSEEEEDSSSVELDTTEED